MKKILKTVFILCVFILASKSAVADCYTGFACSIKDLEAENLSRQEFINNIKNYFNKEVNENLFFGTPDKDVNYNDLFIFNTIV